MLMKRTQVYIDLPTYHLAQAQAKLTGTSLSDLIRSSLKKQLGTKAANHDFLEGIKELNKKYPVPKNTPTDLSLEHDHYLYGTPKKYSK
jgi:hypothetical protein